jgi:hypothetical protein
VLTKPIPDAPTPISITAFASSGINPGFRNEWQRQRERQWRGVKQHGQGGG